MKTILGREDKLPNAAHIEIARKISNAETFLHLSHFVVSNFAQTAMIPIRSNFRSFGKALGEMVVDTKKFYENAIDDGAIVEVTHREILNELGGRKLASKLYGIAASEKIQRALASATGRADVKMTFDALKKKPNSARLKKHLADITLEDADSIMRQDALTEQQIHTAGARMAENTQGLAAPFDLPPVFSAHPLMALPLLYKRFAFRGTKMIIDAIKERPVVNTLKALALLPLFGEAVGDIKAALRGAVAGTGAVEEIMKRGDNLQLTGNKIMDRLAEDYMQAWALGIAGDLVESVARKQSRLSEFVAGPAISDIDEVGKGLFAAMKGDVKPLAKKALKSVPWVGYGLNKRAFPPKVSYSGEMKSLPDVAPVETY